jgi:hypothetical protein
MTQVIAAMRIDREDAVLLLEACGVSQASAFSDERLEDALNEIDAYASESMVAEGKPRRLFSRILDFIQQGGEIIVVSEVRAGRRPAPAPPRQEAPAPRPPVQRAPAAREPRERRPGVISTIIECLTKATPERPTSRQKIHAVLVRRFGPGTEQNRDPRGMMATVRAQVPSGLRIEKKDFKVYSNDRGFWGRWEKAPEAAPAG